MRPSASKYACWSGVTCSEEPHYGWENGRLTWCGGTMTVDIVGGLHKDDPEEEVGRIAVVDLEIGTPSIDTDANPVVEIRSQTAALGCGGRGKN
jgi:hypothetical protein